jgi:Rps23 Pro-64 3,4-dihydroxylase Tpa1-like proline 4-hydroxylase
MSTKKITPPPKPVQASDLVKIDQLVQQLDAVQHIANSGYWLTTEELSVLLGLDSAIANSLIYKTESYQFAWRNFDCVLMRRQDKISFWQLRSPVSQNLKSPNPEPQNSEFQSSESSQSANTQKQNSPSENLIILPNQSQNSSIQAQSVQISQNQPHLPNQPPEPQPVESDIIPTVYSQIDNLLTWNQLRHLFKYVIDQEPNFAPTTNSANDPFYRRSLYLHSFPEFSQLMIERVRSIMPHIISHMDIKDLTVGDVEAQLTAHNDGNYYKIHNDNGSPDCANRELTYVYYFHREPKAFSGGELVLYDSVIKDGYFTGAKSFKTIQPRNNTIVFFPSRCMHEVLPVVCPSKAFADSRFTINGWVRHR